MKGDFTNLIVGDFNGDQRTDFIRQEKGDWDNDDIRTAELYISNSNGTFSKRDLPNADSLKGDFTNIIVGDFTGEGTDDFIRQEKGDWDNDNITTAELFISNNGFFTKSNLTNEPDVMKGDFTNLILGDFNRDRKTDFIRQEKGDWDNDDIRTAELYTNQGNRTFWKQDLTNWREMKGDDGVNIITSNVGQNNTSTTTAIIPSKPDIDIQLFYPNGGFTQSEISLMEKAAQNWERIITKDKDSNSMYKTMTDQGYKFDRNVPIYWS